MFSPATFSYSDPLSSYGACFVNRGIAAPPVVVVVVVVVGEDMPRFFCFMNSDTEFGFPMYSFMMFSVCFGNPLAPISPLTAVAVSVVVVAAPVAVAVAVAVAVVALAMCGAKSEGSLGMTGALSTSLSFRHPSSMAEQYEPKTKWKI